MATNDEFVAKLRKAGVPEDRIVSYLAKKTGSETVAKQLIDTGVPPERVNDYLAKRMTAQEGDPQNTPAELKPNDALGFVVGGNKVMNNILGAGSDALGAVGVPEDVRHTIGGALRDPFGTLIPGKLMNKDQTQALVEQGAGVGQRPGKLGQFAGEVAGTVPGAVASAALAPEALAANGIRVGSPLAVRALSALAGKGFPGAAIQGAEAGIQTTDKTDAAGIAQDATLGGLGGLAGQTLNRVGGAFIAPRFNAAMSDLLGLGQKKFSLAALSGSNYAKKAEDALRSVPGLGGFVEGSQNAMQRDFNRAYLQRAADTADLAIPEITKPDARTYGDIKDAFNQRYGGIFDKASIKSSPTLYKNDAAHKATVDLLKSSGQTELADKVDLLFKPRLDPKTNTYTYGTLDGADIKAVDQALRQEAKALRNPGGGAAVTNANFERAKSLDAARGALKDELGTQQPDIADKLNRADTGYAQFKRAQEAVTAPGQGVDPEAFSAKSLYDKTMTAAGKNQRVNLGSSGDVPGQRLAASALKVMGTKLGDSGTSMRSAVGKVVSGDMQGLGTAGAAGTVGHGFMAAHPIGAAVTAGLYGGYAPGVRDLIANTVIGNSKNKLLVAARKVFDEQALNNTARLPYNAAGDAGTGIEDTPEFRISAFGKRQRLNPATNQYEDIQ